MSQLALPLKLADHAVFASFFSSGNETVVAALEAIASTPDAGGAWLWGRTSSGKSHLLQAVCERAGAGSMYLPLAGFADAGPDILEGLDRQSILCLDDADAVAGERVWEQALFNLYNALEEHGHSLIVATTSPPRSAGFELPDLASRLRRLSVYRIHDLGDADRAAALTLRAHHRGLELPPETARYLLTHSARDMQSLYALLDTLDTEALSQQRRLTVPFVRSVLGSAG